MEVALMVTPIGSVTVVQGLYNMRVRSSAWASWAGGILAGSALAPESDAVLPAPVARRLLPVLLVFGCALSLAVALAYASIYTHPRNRLFILRRFVEQAVVVVVSASLVQLVVFSVWWHIRFRGRQSGQST